MRPIYLVNFWELSKHLQSSLTVFIAKLCINDLTGNFWSRRSIYNLICLLLIKSFIIQQDLFLTDFKTEVDQFKNEPLSIKGGGVKSLDSFLHF